MQTDFHVGSVISQLGYWNQQYQTELVPAMTQSMDQTVSSLSQEHCQSILMT